MQFHQIQPQHRNDCVVRAISIATGKDYACVYAELRARQGSISRGVLPKVYQAYLKDIGWEWQPTMRIGEGCKVHLKEEELPKGGPYILRLSKHLTVLIDGTIYDTHNPSRGGTRCVYGYWQNNL